MVNPNLIVLAGANGDLGNRIARALIGRGAKVRAIVRPNMSSDQRHRLEALGLELVPADLLDREALARACTGAACVVSALNGLHDVIVDRQTVLIEAAAQAGVARFIPSDFSEDFTRTTPGRNRNLDLRREFMRVADRVPIRVTSVLNGAFMDMLGAEMPIVQPGIRRVLYWRSADQLLDFTTKDDVAAFTAHAALDQDTPRILRVAGDSLNARQIAAVMTAISPKPFRPLRAGGIGSLGLMIGAAKLIAPQRGEVFPAWQGMQYMRDMFSGEGKLQPLDNDRYPELHWTSIREHLAAKFGSAASGSGKGGSR